MTEPLKPAKRLASAVSDRLGSVFSGSESDPYPPTEGSRFSGGLFWRTFFLIAFLLTVSMLAWIGSYQFERRGARAEAVSAQIASIVKITQAALVHSDQESFDRMVSYLDNSEGIRIYVAYDNDVIVPSSQSEEWFRILEPHLKEMLGHDTVFSPMVNGDRAFWIRFRIETDDPDAPDDYYWLRFEDTRLLGLGGLRWLYWSAVGLVLALIGAAFISRVLNEPLSRLSASAHMLARGDMPEPLPETGLSDVQTVNRSFNKMVSDLKRVETDRIEILAGISHDLRTPLTRMRLEIELSDLSEESRAGMIADINQMEMIVGQFLDYANLSKPREKQKTNISAVALDAIVGARALGATVTQDIRANTFALVPHVDIRRILDNLMVNAVRYAKNEDGQVDIHVIVSSDDKNVKVSVSDKGPGIPEDQIEHMMRPFTRMNTSRSGAGGSGLGLAIIARIAQREGIGLTVRNGEQGGLCVELVLKATKADPGQAEHA